MLDSDAAKAKDEDRELLAPVYGWFTKGFDALDLYRSSPEAARCHSAAAR
jgi:hypothetical protein